jgi:hypothetical protein
VLNLILPFLSSLLPDVLKRILPAEKMSEEDRAQLAANLQLELMKADWQQVESSYADMANARDLAKADIAKGNAFTGALSAIVRPLWGIGAFVLVAHYAIGHTPIDAGLKDIIQTVIWFYFGGRVIEKVTPHATSAISSFSGGK